MYFMHYCRFILRDKWPGRTSQDDYCVFPFRKACTFLKSLLFSQVHKIHRLVTEITITLGMPIFKTLAIFNGNSRF